MKISYVHLNSTKDEISGAYHSEEADAVEREQAFFRMPFARLPSRYAKLLSLFRFAHLKRVSPHFVPLPFASVSLSSLMTTFVCPDPL